MSNNIFRIFNPKGPKEDPVEKRRAQLRRAQQSYRDRKDVYTKSLEAEIARTRASEANLMRQIQHLHDTVQMLTGVLSQHGIPLPANFSYDDVHEEAGREPASALGNPPVHTAYPVRLAGRSKNAAGVTPEHLPGPANTPREAAPQLALPDWLSDYASAEDRADHSVQRYYRDSPATRAEPWCGDLKVSVPPCHDGTRLCELDPAVVGMEFVLTLEHPCLGHLAGDPNKPHEPTGHALTTSAQLQFSFPSPPSESHEPVLPSYEEAPAALLDRLLNLAPGVCSEGEVTPVQAWSYVRSQPHFGGLDVRTLRKLAEKLRDTVKCHGFGAVVQVVFLQNVVYETLMLGRAF